MNFLEVEIPNAGLRERINISPWFSHITVDKAYQTPVIIPDKIPRAQVEAKYGRFIYWINW